MSDKKEKPHSNNRLSRGDAIRLYNWLDTHYERLAKMTRDQATEEASRALGKTYVREHILGVLRDMGREVPFITRRPTIQKRETYGRRVEQVASQVLALACVVENLCISLGVAFDPDNRVDRKILNRILYHKPLHDSEDSDEVE